MIPIRPNRKKPTTMNETDALYARVSWRLLPFLFLCYVVAYLDRVNVGFAKLQMQADLHLSDTVYGLGAGIFFLGYFLFEVPANLLLAKVGARRWIARIMISWGLVSAASMMSDSATSFYVLRFLLGVAEAGFFPGVILYLTYWYPSQRRARIVAVFMSAVAVAGVVGGPLSGWLMHSMGGVAGLRGWQWLFLLEGLPSVLVGIATLFYLDDGIRAARWLTTAQQAALLQALAADEAPQAQWSLRHVFGSSRVWMLCLIYFLFVMGLYGVGFWLPQLIRNSGVQDLLQVGLMTAVPYGVAALVMIVVARHSDRSGERRWHAALASFAGAAGLQYATLHGGDPLLSLAALSVATAGILSTFPVFWSLPTAMLGGSAAAAGIAMINSVGNLAGFVSPYLVGAIKDATHSTAHGMTVLAASLVAGGLLTLFCLGPKGEVL
jgi:D-galactonate transporter